MGEGGSALGNEEPEHKEDGDSQEELGDGLGVVELVGTGTTSLVVVGDPVSGTGFCGTTAAAAAEVEGCGKESEGKGSHTEGDLEIAACVASSCATATSTKEVIEGSKGRVLQMKRIVIAMAGISNQ